MKILTNDELKKVDGGGFSVGFMIGLGIVVTFLIGVIDGIVRPLKCN